MDWDSTDLMVPGLVFFLILTSLTCFICGMLQNEGMALNQGKEEGIKRRQYKEIHIIITSGRSKF